MMENGANSGKPKPKNILVIHLESVSNTILWQYRVELGTVWRLMQKSLKFPWFQTNSTSTEMTVSDFLYGDASVNDHRAHFRGGKPQIYASPQYYLHTQGYELLILTRNFMFAQPRTLGNTYDTPSLNDFYRKQTEFMQSCRDAEKPFFLYVNNAISHMAFDGESKAQAKTFSERFKNGYLDFDASVNFTLSKLMELGLWENTIIACYGDHGDELWSHGVSKGYCHIITPYASLCRTPLFIYNNGADEGYCFNACSTVDLFTGLIDMALPACDFVWPQPPAGNNPLTGETRRRHSSVSVASSFGRPLGSQSNVFLFSQNLFALQLEYDDPEKGLTKGYAVTNLQYRLTVSSGGTNVLNGGMELFNEVLDPANMLNLLNFFELNRNGDIVGTRPPHGEAHPDFAAFFEPDNIETIKHYYRVLKGELQAFVRAKEYRAMAYNDGERHLMPDNAFKRVRENICGD